MTGLDTTALIQLADADDVLHQKATALIQGEAATGADILIAPQTVAEFLHIITDDRRFRNPMSMPAALEWIDAFLENQAVRLSFPSAASVRLANEWMRKHSLGRKRILDTQLAATFYSAGCARLVTSNPLDFKIFGVFDLVSP